MTIIFDQEEKVKLVRSIFENFPEYALNFICTKWKYEDFLFEFEGIDEDEGNQYTVDLDMAIKGFDLFMEAYSTNKIHFYGFDPLDDCSYDADVTDAILQYALLGDLIYG